MRVSGAIDRMASEVITSQARLSANQGRSPSTPTRASVSTSAGKASSTSVPAEITRSVRRP